MVEQVLELVLVVDGWRQLQGKSLGEGSLLLLLLLLWCVLVHTNPTMHGVCDADLVHFLHHHAASCHYCHPLHRHFQCKKSLLLPKPLQLQPLAPPAPQQTHSQLYNKPVSLTLF